MTEFFETLVHVLKLVNNVTKSSILDIFVVPNTPDLFIQIFCWYSNLLSVSMLKDTLICLLKDTLY